MIVAGIVNSFLVEILQGIHEAGDSYMMSLYNSTANLARETQVYTTKGEVIGAKGYVPGGQLLKGYIVKQFDEVSIMSFDNPTWLQSSINARAALIYNKSKQNRALVVLDFGQDIISTNGSFFVTLPEATAEDAIIQIGAL